MMFWKKSSVDFSGFRFISFHFISFHCITFHFLQFSYTITLLDNVIVPMSLHTYDIMILVSRPKVFVNHFFEDYVLFITVCLLK